MFLSHAKTKNDLTIYLAENALTNLSLYSELYNKMYFKFGGF